MSRLTLGTPVVIIRPAWRRGDDWEQSVSISLPLEMWQDARVMRFLMVLFTVRQDDEGWDMSSGGLAAFAPTGSLRT